MHVAVSDFARHFVASRPNSTEMDQRYALSGDPTCAASRIIEDLGRHRCDSEHRPSSSPRNARARAVRRRVSSSPPTRYDSTISTASAHAAGLVVSGNLLRRVGFVEIVELPDHPWFVASQFHPSSKSRHTARAVFRGFVGAALARTRRAGGPDRRSRVATADYDRRWPTPPRSTRRRPDALPRARRLRARLRGAGRRRRRPCVTCATWISTRTRTVRSPRWQHDAERLRAPRGDRR